MRFLQIACAEAFIIYNVEIKWMKICELPKSSKRLKS